jgi:hypothetical protein
MASLGLSASRLAKHIDAPVSRVQAIIAEKPVDRQRHGPTARALLRHDA